MSRHLDPQGDDIELPIKCKCKVCGKTWTSGDQGDNETICIRCEIADQDFETNEFD